MKRFLVIFVCCGIGWCFSGVAEAEPNRQNREKQVQALLAREKQLAQEMFQLRVKLLEKDPALKKLRAKIMELHTELALQLDSNKEMRVLSNKLREVKTSLAKIQEQAKREE
ncbi:MAG: hypothetical protein PHH77_09920 [Victivallaceae bacterium]|nr:hypothetical protein [Victivallaceae bacterium]